jgi:L-cysteine/cystine lyase
VRRSPAPTTSVTVELQELRCSTNRLATTGRKAAYYVSHVVPTVTAEARADARAAFPVLRRSAYLNAGTFGPLASATVEATRTAAERELQEGRGGERYYSGLKELRARVRDGIARLIGVDAAHVALTSSTSMGCTIVLAGLELDPHDEIVTTDEEHFGLLGALHASGASVRVVPTRGLPPGESLEALVGAVGPRSSLVALSHVSWMTGNLLPAAAVKEAVDVPVLIDGAQAVGAVPVEVGGFDFYTVSGQKWLCGPDATGALYVADPDRLRVALPTYFSQESHDPDGAFRPVQGSARFDSGPLPVPSLSGLEAALAGAPEWRFAAAREITGRFRDALCERFEVVTAPGQGTLVSFRVPGDAAEAVARLFEAGVIARDVPETGWIRVSCGYWTNEDDLDRLLSVLEA